MPEVRIIAEPRTEFGKGGARRTRRAGKLPAVLYGHGTDPRHLSLPSREFEHALRTDGANVLLDLQLAEGSELALPKSIQRDPIRGAIEHVDLILVRRGERITVEIVIQIVGEVVAGGLLDQSLTTLSVTAEATNIPSGVEVSIDGSRDRRSPSTPARSRCPTESRSPATPSRSSCTSSRRRPPRSSRPRSARSRPAAADEADEGRRRGRARPPRLRPPRATRRRTDAPRRDRRRGRRRSLAGARPRQPRAAVRRQPPQRRLHGARRARRPGRRPVQEPQGARRGRRDPAGGRAGRPREAAART